MSFRSPFSAFRASQQAFSSAFKSHTQSSSRRAYSQAPSQGQSAFRKWGTRLGPYPLCFDPCTYVLDAHLPWIPRDGADRAAIAIALPGVYVLGAAFPPKVVLLLYPRYSPPPPSGDSTQGKALMGETESELQKLYIIARLRNKVGWYESRESAAS